MADKNEEAAEWAAIRVMHHIDTMYPAIWQGVPTTAKESIKNTMIAEFKKELDRRDET